MRIIFSLVLATSIHTSTAVKAAGKNDGLIDTVLTKFVDDVVIPGYDQFQDTSLGLSKSMNTLCNNPDRPNLERVREAFNYTVAAWARIEMMRAGPVNRNNRFERVLFYPDRKSTGLRHTIAIMRDEDQRALSIPTLQKKSVATQGLGALEYVLFGNDNGQLIKIKQGFRCRYGLAITTNLHLIASEITDEWQDPKGISSTWKNPDPSNPAFRNQREALNAILGLLINNLQVVHDIRLGSFLKKSKDDDRPKRAIYRRSENTFKAISANIDALRMMFVKSDLRSLLSEDAKSISDSILFEFRQAINVSRGMTMPVEAALKDPAQREKLQYLSLVLKSLITRMDEEFALATGLAAGFSFSDGD